MAFWERPRVTVVVVIVVAVVVMVANRVTSIEARQNVYFCGFQRAIQRSKTKCSGEYIFLVFDKSLE